MEKLLMKNQTLSSNKKLTRIGFYDIVKFKHKRRIYSV